MTIYPQERIALFVDGSNLYAAARALGFDIDYRRLLEVFSDRGKLLRAFYYTALIEDQDFSAEAAQKSRVLGPHPSWAVGSCSGFVGLYGSPLQEQGP